MSKSCVLELNDALLSDLQRLRCISGNSVESIVGAGMGVKEDLETVSGSFELIWDLRRGEGDDVQKLVVVDDGRRRRRWRVHDRCVKQNQVVRRVEKQVSIKHKQTQITRPSCNPSRTSSRTVSWL